MHPRPIAMRDHEQSDRKAPRPITVPRKGTNPFEASEGAGRSRDLIDRDRHRHV